MEDIFHRSAIFVSHNPFQRYIRWGLRFLCARGSQYFTACDRKIWYKIQGLLKKMAFSPSIIRIYSNHFSSSLSWIIGGSRCLFHKTGSLVHINKRVQKYGMKSDDRGRYSSLEFLHVYVLNECMANYFVLLTTNQKLCNRFLNQKYRALNYCLKQCNIIFV